MKTLLFVSVILGLCAITYAQKSYPPFYSVLNLEEEWDLDQSTNPYCRVRFWIPGAGDAYDTNRVGYTETLRPKRKQAHRATFSSAANNKIVEISYEGDCACWIVLFTGQSYAGSSIGFWNWDQDEQFKLSPYMSYDQSNKVWDQWDRVASSYSIYCWF